MNHTALLNSLISHPDFCKYLEIGVQDPANNFDKVNAAFKLGVDPAPINHKLIMQCTSDVFFDVYVHKVEGVFDVVFIDGMHHADQVKRDFDNSLKYLSDKGFIVIHDCLPVKEEHAIVPRISKIWNGDVYKFIFQLNEYDGIDFKTLDFDHGCCVVWKDATKKGFKMASDINWSFYQHNREFLRIAETL